jgi:class 3 adenylate cyclase
MFSFLKSKGDLETTEYKLWRQNFMQKRLRLGMRIAFFYYVSLIAILFINFFVGQVSSFEVKFVRAIVILLGILFTLIFLKKQRSQLQISITFFSISWTFTILYQLVDTILKAVNPDAILIGWMITFFSQATLVPVRWRFHLVSQLGAFAYYIIVNTAFGNSILPTSTPILSWIINIFWTCLICNLSVYLYEKLARSEFYSRHISEKLLLNILPESIATRLKDEENTIADSFNNVTVLFADIVGFTELSSQLPPDLVVGLLNQIFSRFDRLAEFHQLEKIKTIGDAYLVVAGLPFPKDDHAEAIADMALNMQQAILDFNRETGQNLSIRTGINTGPVVAGVIGLKKFAYDLWGDTVNTASRMESHGIAGKIQVSETTYNCLNHLYKFEERGFIKVKGKGEMKAYLLIEKKLVLF